MRDLTRSELYAAEEVFLCGTSGEVTQISCVNDIVVGREYPGCAGPGSVAVRAIGGAWWRSVILPLSSGGRIVACRSYHGDGGE